MYYDFSKVRKLVQCDWVKDMVDKAEAKLEYLEGSSERFDDSKVTIVNCDMHKMPFKENSFDTVVDTFGLECAYDLDRAWK